MYDNLTVVRNRALVNFLKSVENLTDLNNIPKPAERLRSVVHAGENLSNSGNSLELQVPSCSWKTISGWSNYSGRVKSLEDSEKEVGNRGSKSMACQNTPASHNGHAVVKEQRVDGSCIGFPMLRCTLTVFERSFLITDLSKQISLYSTQVSTNQPKDSLLNPWFITGFVDAEGSFIVSIVKDTHTRTGWNIQLRFKIALHKKDLSVMEQIKTYFGGVGKIDIAGKDRDSFSYTISSRKLITEVVLPHFDQYSLITNKKADYELFKRIIEMMNRGEHVTEVGLQNIINIRASLNKGLSPSLKDAFPNFVPVPRPLVEANIPDHQWVAGFTSGEGCFYIVISKSNSESVGFNVRLRFILSQDARDEHLIRNFITYFNCGSCEKAKDGMVYFKVTKFADNYEKIIPFFSKYHIHGVKAMDFQDWCKVAELMKVKAHLTREGLDQIAKIKENTNRGRTDSN